MNKPSILILDAESNAAPSLVQSLGRQGYKVYLAGSKTDTLGRHSRFCQMYLLYPDPLQSRRGFLEWFSKTTQENTFDLILPVTDITIYPLMEYSEQVPLKGLILPPKNSFDFFFNKAKTLELANACDVPYPPSQIIRSGENCEVRVGQFPCYIKPARSKVWEGDRGVDLDARLISSQEELERMLEVLSPFGDVLIQKYVPGIGIGIELFCVNGEILLSFAHRRIHEYPLTGGGSTYRVSIPMPQTLFEQSSRLVKAIRWTGVAMVEFKSDGKESYLMEVNGRFWGSLPLSVRAGADFPKAVVEWELKEQLPNSNSYRTGVFSRKFAMDLAWFKRNLVANRRDPFLLTRPVVRTILEYFRVLSGKEFWDHATWSDPVPILLEIRNGISQSLSPVFRKIANLINRIQMPLIMTLEKKRSRAQLRALAPRKILLVCYGNICRSPFTEKILEKLLPANLYKLNSCGFIQESSRKSPLEIRRAALTYGVDLTDHRSKPIDLSLCSWADIVVIMDYHNWLHLKRFSPDCLTKTVWLGAWTTDGTLEIPDPFEESTDRIAEILHKISECCRQFADELTSIEISEGNFSRKTDPNKKIP